MVTGLRLEKVQNFKGVVRHTGVEVVGALTYVGVDHTVLDSGGIFYHGGLPRGGKQWVLQKRRGVGLWFHVGIIIIQFSLNVLFIYIHTLYIRGCVHKKLK